MRILILALLLVGCSEKQKWLDENVIRFCIVEGLHRDYNGNICKYQIGDTQACFMYQNNDPMPVDCGMYQELYKMRRDRPPFRERFWEL